MTARWGHFGMMLFKPLPLNAHLLKEIIPAGTAEDVDFWLVDDPFINLKRGRLVEHAQLEVLIKEATEAREDEEISYAKCA